GAQSLVAFRQLGTLARLGTLEEQLRDELRCTLATRDVTHGAGVHQDGYRNQRKLRDRRHHQLETVFESATLEPRKLILARPARFRALGFPNRRRRHWDADAD